MSYFFVTVSINFMIFLNGFKDILQFVHGLLPKKWSENLEVSVWNLNLFFKLKF